MIPVNLEIEVYPLPAEIYARITDLADGADALFIGEIHGTQEIPRIVAGLLPMFSQRGYRGFGLEVPAFEQESLQAWLSEPKNPVPDFYARPWYDGRGSREMLALIQRAGRAGLRVFCFDPPMKKNASWNARDAGMAQLTARTWQKEFPNDKIILMCGNNHASLKPHPQGGQDLWPSFAESLRQQMPGKECRTINIVPGAGEFFNMGIQKLQNLEFPGAAADRLASARIILSESVSLQVNFPECHAATFLSSPKAPGQLQLLQSILRHIALKVGSGLKPETHIL